MASLYDPKEPPVSPQKKEFDPEKFIAKSVEMPARVLDQTVVAGTEILEKIPDDFRPSGVVKHAKSFWHTLGPGLTTGASDDDPSGIATYSQTGAQHGFGFLWLSVLTFPLMSFVQEMCARIGLVTGRGLAGNIRVHFSRRLIRFATLLLFAANAFNIGANLGAMAKAVQLMIPDLSFGWLVVAFAVGSLILQIFMPYAKYAHWLKWLALILVGYIISALLADINWGEAFRHTIVPQFELNRDTLLLICAILGTTISPYLFFWQTSQEVEENIEAGKTTLRERQTATAPAEVKRMRIDVWSGMLISNVVMFFIIAACGATLYPNGITEITSAAQAAEALRPFAGDAAYFLFAIGIIGTGLLAIPVLAGSSSYAIAESLRWKSGLHRNLSQAYSFYGVIIISMFIGLGLNFIGLDPIKALIYSAIANGIIAPFILFFIVKLSSNRKIMGRWVNKPLVTAMGWFTTALMAAAGIGAIWSLL